MAKWIEILRTAAAATAAGLLLCVSAGGCRRSDTVRIGVSQCSSDDWRAKMNEEIMREALFHDNVQVEIRSADDSNQKQIDDIRYFASHGFDIIIASPNEAGALTPVIREVYESGTPVVLFDRNIDGEYYTAWQGADNREIGRSAARLALALTGGECRAIEICGLSGSTPAIERREGFLDIVSQYSETRNSSGGAFSSGTFSPEAHSPEAHSPETAFSSETIFKILGRGDGDWNDSKGFATADSLLELYPQTNLIYAHNDRMAVAASRAARLRGRRDIRIIGIDAAPEIGIRAVADSVIDATFLYPTEGHQLIRTALAILEGRPYERHFTLPTAPAVDLSNAEMLLLQNNALKDETEKIELLKAKVDTYMSQHLAQTLAIYAMIAVLLLAAVLIFILLRAHRNNVRHHRMLDAQNRELGRQRDQLDSLYSRLQEAMQSKIAFFTNVSHDLRTPLTLIADPVEQLARAENIDDNQRTLMRLADKNVKILRRLINQILDFRKYESGKLELNLTETDMRARIAEWGESFRNAAVKRHIKLTVDVDQTVADSMAVDVEKFERIFFNLLSNALKYTPANESVGVSFTSDGDEAVLTVADTGRGMSAGDLAHIFDNFYRADKINPDGSGLGLSLVKAFAELHGGSVTARSEPGRGSVFTVRIPVVHTSADAQQSAAMQESTITEELADIESDRPDTPIDESTPVVLVIDDNADIRTLVAGLLGGRYTVLEAAGGEQGIRLASKYGPDLIICDVMMPGMDGMETCRRMKSEMTTSHIPVLMLTACSLDEQRIEGYECGADAYLSKPFDSRVLTARCDALIANRRRLRDAFVADAGIAVRTGGRPASADAAAAASSPRLTGGDIDSEFYRRFVAAVGERMSDSELSVEELASELGLSRVQFYRKIKALTNYSPAELLRILRLKRADTLLRTTESTVSEISYAVGFSSPSYFTKCYRDYFGEIPTDVQKRTSKISNRQ